MLIWRWSYAVWIQTKPELIVQSEPFFVVMRPTASTRAETGQCNYVQQQECTEYWHIPVCTFNTRTEIQTVRVEHKAEMTLRLFHLQQNCLEADVNRWLKQFSLINNTHLKLKVPGNVKTSMRMWKVLTPRIETLWLVSSRFECSLKRTSNHRGGRILNSCTWHLLLYCLWYIDVLWYNRSEWNICIMRLTVS